MPLQTEFDLIDRFGNLQSTEPKKQHSNLKLEREKKLYVITFLQTDSDFQKRSGFLCFFNPLFSVMSYVMSNAMSHILLKTTF